MTSPENLHPPEIQIESLIQNIENQVANDRKRSFISSLILVTVGVLFLSVSIWQVSQLEQKKQQLNIENTKLDEELKGKTTKLGELEAKLENKAALLQQIERKLETIRGSDIETNQKIATMRQNIKLSSQSIPSPLQTYSIKIYYQKDLQDDAKKS